MDKRTEKILELLLPGKPQTAEKLADEIHVSTKTVRKLIKDLNEELEKYGAHIGSRYGLGYQLSVTNEILFEKYQKNITALANSPSVPSTSEERIQYLLEYLMNASSYVKLDDLSESLYISKRTLTSDLKEVEKRLKKYNISLVRKSNHGIRAEGKEFNLRRCIAFLTSMKLEKDDSVIELISSGISECLMRYDFPISNVSFQNLAIHIYVAILRIRSGHPISMQEKPYKSVMDFSEYKIAGEIADFILRNFDMDLPQAEVVYIAIHLAGKKIILQENKHDNLVISEEINDLVTEILQLVYDAFKFDFRSDLELRMSLCKHIVPLCVRIQYDMVMKNPMLCEVQQKFFLAYMIASHASIILNQKYKTTLSDDEIGYLAFPFALALERQKTEIEKKNLVLVCASGRGSAQLLLYQYKKDFASYINRIEVCDVRNLHNIDFEDVDYVISSVPISIPIPVPILEVHCFLQNEDAANIKKALSNSCLDSVKRYYDKQLFLPELAYETKEETLRAMCDLMTEKKGLPHELYELVQEREALAPTAFGNMVAMPHPYQAISHETHVAVAILNRPIDWGDQEIQVVFLVSVADCNQNSSALQVFYQMTASFMLSQKHIQDLIKKRDYEWFIETMSNIQKQLKENGI